MKLSLSATEFLPAERIPIDVIHRQAETIQRTPLTSQVLNSVLNYVFVLNPQRQIVFASQNWHQLIPELKPEALLGLRPGEALGCVHAHEQPTGCGSTAYCEECGAVKAILASLSGSPAMNEYHLTRIVNCREEAMDLLIYASPLNLHGENYYLLTVIDISHEHRRRALERIFFHDVINSAGGLEALAALLGEAVPASVKTDWKLLQDGLHDLYDQVQAQKDLAAAENHELKVLPAPFIPALVLEDVVRLYQNHLLARDRRLRLVQPLASNEITSDVTVLRRVLGNLVKNALEATPPGETVSAGCEAMAGRIRFWVHNPAFMERSVQLQVFSRSFSTKGLGRGLGTYSARLLTEKYLGGKIGFTTDPVEGTTFFVWIGP